MNSKPKKKKKSWGGARPGSGPKPKDASELKKTITLYIKDKDITRMGGESAFKEKCYALLA